MRDKKEVEKLLITMRGDYLEKLPEKIEVIANTLHALAESKQNQCGLYDEMYRAVHNIKGTAGTYGLHVY